MATHLYNRNPMQALHYIKLWIFRSKCFMCPRSYKANKLASKSTACIFLGYPQQHNGFFCYDPVSRKIYVSWDKFFEGDFSLNSFLGKEVDDIAPDVNRFRSVSMSLILVQEAKGVPDQVEIQRKLHWSLSVYTISEWWDNLPFHTCGWHCFNRVWSSNGSKDGELYG